MSWVFLGPASARLSKSGKIAVRRRRWGFPSTRWKQFLSNWFCTTYSVRNLKCAIVLPPLHLSEGHCIVNTSIMIPAHGTTGIHCIPALRMHGPDMGPIPPFQCPSLGPCWPGGFEAQDQEHHGPEWLGINSGLSWEFSISSLNPGKTSQNSTNTYTYHYTTPQIHVDLAWHCQIGVGGLHSSNKYTCSHDVSLRTNKTLCTKTTGDVYLQSSNLDIDINQH